MGISTGLRAVPALGVALGAMLLAPVAASAQGGSCPPGQTFGATFTSYEGGARAPLIATHDMTVRADWPDGSDVEQPRLSVPDGVRVIGTRPREIRIVVPTGASLPVTATWTQPAEPSNPDSTARCIGTQTTALPVLAPLPPRAVYDVHRDDPSAMTSFAVLPDRNRADLSPLTVSVRVARAARFPAAGVRARTLTIPMRRVDEVRYARRLPGAAYQTTPVKCRFFSLTCGRLTTDAYALGPLRRGTRRELRGQFGELLARTQPRRRAAPFGVRIHAFVFSVGFRGPRTVGYDVQVRQSGELVGRARRAARCAPEVRFGFKRLTCRVLRRANG